MLNDINIHRIDTTKGIEFRTSKIVLAGLIFICALFFVFSAVVFYQELNNFKLGDYSRVYPVFVFLFLSISFLFWSIYLTIANPIVLKLTSKSLDYRNKKILWKDIETIEIVYLGGGMESSEPDLDFKIKLLDGSFCYLSVSYLSIKVTDIFELLKAYHKNSKQIEN